MSVVETGQFLPLGVFKPHDGHIRYPEFAHFEPIQRVR